MLINRHSALSYLMILRGSFKLYRYVDLLMVFWLHFMRVILFMYKQVIGICCNWPSIFKLNFSDTNGATKAESSKGNITTAESVMLYYCSSIFVLLLQYTYIEYIITRTDFQLEHITRSESSVFQF